MDEALNWIRPIFSHPAAVTAVRVAAVLIIGLAISAIVPKRITWTAIPKSRLFLLQKAIRYGVLVVTGAWVMRELGFDISTVLGAAGIFTVAIGFASQTSASNLISGLFLMGEGPFRVGDIIRVADVSGEVLSIDLLSVKIRTFDNLFVRVPNETMLKSNVTNVTRFPIRRIDMPIGIAYKENIERVREVLLAVANDNVLCLDEPKPVVLVLGYGESSINLQFSVWSRKESILDVRNAMYSDVKIAFDKNEIEIPFPHRKLIGLPPSPAEDRPPSPSP